jgi:tetratricopeptide (TPR) repeat protein
MIFGVTIAGLICSHASLRAQPASEPAPTGGAPTPTGDEPAPTGDEPAPTGDAPIVTDDPDKPWSQGVSAESRTAARALFLEGNRLFRIPLFARAAEQYAAALAKWKHPAFYFNLALAQLNLGKEVEAYESLQHALRHGEAPLGADQFREAQKQLAEVKRQIGQLRVTCQTPGAEVTLDGVTLFIGPGSYEGWVKAKAHEITVKKAGYLSEARRVTVSSRQLQDIELVTLGQATDASRRWAVWKPWAIVIGGGAIAAAGGGFHALASRNFTAYDEQFRGLDCALPQGDPPQVPGCPKDDPRLEEQGLNARLKLAKREQRIAIGGYIVGGSLIATGVVLLYMNRPRLSEREAAGGATRAVTVVPEVSGDMFGVVMSVSH